MLNRIPNKSLNPKNIFQSDIYVWQYLIATTNCNLGNFMQNYVHSTRPTPMHKLNQLWLVGKLEKLWTAFTIY